LIFGRVEVNSYLANMPRKGVSQFFEEKEKEKEQEKFLEEVDFSTETRVNDDKGYKEEFDRDQTFLQKTGKFVMDVLSIPEQIDKAVGIHGTRQKAINVLTGGLSEDHMVAALAGEMLVPDTIDLVTLGLGYIPRRVLLKGPKAIKMFLKYKKAKLPKIAKRSQVDVPIKGSKFATDADYEIMAKGVERTALRTGQNIDEALSEAGVKLRVDTGPVDDLPTAEGTRKLFDEIGLNDDVKLSIKEMLDEDKSSYFRRKGKAAVADPAFEWNMYDKTRKTLVEDFLEGIEFLNIDPASIHAHHIAGLRVTSSLFDGLDAAGRKQLMHVLLNEGIATGNNPANLMALHKVPHIKVIHQYLSDHLGKYGDKLLEPDVMKRLSVQDRIPYARKFAERIRISQRMALEENRKFLNKAVFYNDPKTTMQAAVDIYEYEKSLKEVLRGLNAQDIGAEQLLKVVQEGKRYKKRGITKRQQDSLDKAIEEGMIPYQPLIDPTEDAFY